MLNAAADQGLIKGVPIWETGEQITHAQFANDTSITIVAKRCSMDHLFRIFKILGDASGLYVKEQGVKAIHILEKEVPTELLNLDWEWELDDTLTK